MPRKFRRLIQHNKKDLSMAQSEVKFDEQHQQQQMHQINNIESSLLNEFIVKQDEESIDEAGILHKSNEKILIIAAVSGMGKTLILDHFTEKSTAENFFLKIILNTCKDTLSDENFKDELNKSNDLIEFVLESLLNKKDKQEILLLKHLAQEEKLILMFDGLDEVIDYKDKVILLIDALIRENRIKKILITTRNHLKEELEDHFQTFAFNLNNFNDDDQQNFLYKYWRNVNKKNQKRAPSAQLKQSAEELSLKIKSIKLNKLIGIPLQTKMLADIYCDRDFSTIKIANIADLYNEFVESKIVIQFERTNDNVKIANLSKQFKKYFDDSKEKFYSDHIKLSSYVLFEQNKHSKISSALVENDEKIVEILEYGVIVDYINKTPIFLHQSFAEFFVAKSSFTKLNLQDAENDKELEQILTDRRNLLVRKFLNDFIEKREAQFSQAKEPSQRDYKREVEICCEENLKFLLKYFTVQRAVDLLKASTKCLILASLRGIWNLLLIFFN
jgi:hypothetical protein